MRRIPFIAAILVPLLGGSLRAGTLYFSQDNNPNGLYTLNTSTGAATPAGSAITGVTSSTVGLSAGPNGMLYGSTFEQLAIINPDGSGSSVLPGDTRAEALEYVAHTGTLYGMFNRTFFTIDTATGNRLATLASPDADLEGLAYANGKLYGLESFSGNLYAYDVTSGAWEDLGPTGVAFVFAGLAFDPGSGLLYAIGAQDSQLYSISLSTGQATPIGDTGISGATGGGLAWLESASVPENSAPEPASFTAALSAVVAGMLRRHRNRT